MSKSVLIPLAEGFEEIEALAPVDLLRRAEVEVTLASCERGLLVVGRNGVKVEADALLDDVLDGRFDGVLVPGGPATAALRDDKRILDLVRRQASAQGIVAAICAAPTVLHKAGLLAGRRYTGHASISAELPELDPSQAVVVDRELITSRGAGTAIAFGLTLVAALVGQPTADAIAGSIHLM